MRNVYDSAKSNLDFCDGFYEDPVRTYLQSKRWFRRSCHLSSRASVDYLRNLLPILTSYYFLFCHNILIPSDILLEVLLEFHGNTEITTPLQKNVWEFCKNPEVSFSTNPTPYVFAV